VILGGDLVGVYLHGSGAMACFNPDRSDIDLLVVARKALSPEQRRVLAELLLARSGASYPVELTLLTTGQLHPWRHPSPFDFHYSEMWRESLAQQLADGEPSSRLLTDPDLAAQITTLRARGRVVVGAPIHEVFPEVPEADFRQVILADLEWIRHHSTQIYGVLNACRILAYLDGQGLLSKAEGADWALETFRWRTGRRSPRRVRRIATAGTSPVHRKRCKRSPGGRQHEQPKAHSGDEALIPADAGQTPCWRWWCDRPQSSSGGLDKTPAAMPASAVSSAAATGETMAPMGRRVGSDPVTYTGSAMLSTVAIPQTATVAAARPIQKGWRDTLPRSLPIAHTNAPVPARPQNQAPKAATGRCCCSLPVTMSGASRLISVTAIQIPAIPAMVHTTQEPSAVAERRSEPDAIVLLPGQS
jgi:hypothetical protein